MPHPKKPPAGSLDEYRKKRSADVTSEPFGGDPSDTPVSADAAALSFVVHLHDARRLHWDLRLEWGGVLHSWALPKGPSLDPAEKRMAVHVEDHPLEYGDFEGVIPEGNYGAGPSLVWDKGHFLCEGDPDAGLAAGKLLFELRGHKLRGVWTLVRTKRRGAPDDKQWLLIKKPDVFAVKEGERPPQDSSVVSGLTLDDLRAGRDRGAPLKKRFAKLGAPKKTLRVADVKPMLAQPRASAFSDPAWIYELKYDGYRLFAAREGGVSKLVYRRGSNVTARFPELGRSLEKLPFEDLLMDGELVVLGPDGRPSFHGLQQRSQLSSARDVARASLVQPVTMFVFDLLACDGYDLRALPLTTRKALLKDLLPPAGVLRYSEHVEGEGEALYAQVRTLGLEGIICKRANSPYRAAARSPDWQKVRAEKTSDFVIVGWSDPKGARGGFGSLHLAAFETDEDGGSALRYAGRVGSGFDEQALGELYEGLRAIEQPKAPCLGETPRGRAEHWCEARLVGEVRYLEVTPARMLRHPVWVRLRDDKPPEECEFPAARVEPEAPSVAALQPKPPQQETIFTNLTKVFWPEHGYTKGDLIEYHRQISAWLLPYLNRRPLVLTRYPDGIHGKSFFQKDAPAFAPSWVRTEILWSEHAQREIRYFLAETTEALLYIINLGAIPLHVWGSRIHTLQSPDWCILDLDPKGAPFTDVLRCASEIRRLCEEIELPSFIKTSGQAGLHILLPLGGLCSFVEARTLGELMARAIVARLPGIATIARAIPARGGRVYIDYLQNGHGRLLVSPYCARPVPGASVSATLRWSEVDKRLDPGKFTIKTLPARMDKLGEDPVLPVLTTKPDLVAALTRLGELLTRETHAARKR